MKCRSEGAPTQLALVHPSRPILHRGDISSPQPFNLNQQEQKPMLAIASGASPTRSTTRCDSEEEGVTSYGVSTPIHSEL